MGSEYAVRNSVRVRHFWASNGGISKVRGRQVDIEQPDD